MTIRSLLSVANRGTDLVYELMTNHGWFWCVVPLFVDGDGIETEGVVECDHLEAPPGIVEVGREAFTAGDWFFSRWR